MYNNSLFYLSVATIASMASCVFITASVNRCAGELAAHLIHPS